MNEKERTARFNNLIEVIRKSETFYMPILKHKCGAPACLTGHCRAHFGEGLRTYLDISKDIYIWLVSGHFSRKNWRKITRVKAIAALEMVRDRKVPDNPYKFEFSTID